MLKMVKKKLETQYFNVYLHVREDSNVNFDLKDAFDFIILLE